MNIGQNIKNARIKKGLSQQELGDLLGITQSAVGQLENNKTSPKIDTLNRVANALDVPLSILVAEESFGNKIKNARLSANLTAVQLAKLCDTTLRAINNIENNNASPSYSLFIKLISALNIPFDDFAIKDDIQKIETDNFIAMFKELNEEGQKKVLEYISDIIDNPKYKTDK